VDRLACGEVVAELAGGFLLASVKQKVASVRQVVGHETRCELRIALFDCDEDRLVEVQGVLEVDELRGHHHHVEHAAMDGLKEPSREPIS